MLVQTLLQPLHPPSEMKVTMYMCIYIVIHSLYVNAPIVSVQSCRVDHHIASSVCPALRLAVMTAAQAVYLHINAICSVLCKVRTHQCIGHLYTLHMYNWAFWDPKGVEDFIMLCAYTCIYMYSPSLVTSLDCSVDAVGLLDGDACIQSITVPCLSRKGVCIFSMDACVCNLEEVSGIPSFMYIQIIRLPKATQHPGMCIDCFTIAVVRHITP